MHVEARTGPPYVHGVTVEHPPQCSSQDFPWQPDSLAQRRLRWAGLSAAGHVRPSKPKCSLFNVQEFFCPSTSECSLPSTDLDPADYGERPGAALHDVAQRRLVLQHDCTDRPPVPCLLKPSQLMHSHGVPDTKTAEGRKCKSVKQVGVACSQADLAVQIFIPDWPRRCPAGGYDAAFVSRQVTLVSPVNRPMTHVRGVSGRNAK